MNYHSIYRDTGEAFFTEGHSIFINHHQESSEPHLHRHDFIEISYVSSGAGIHILGDKTYQVSKGDLFLINYQVPHEFRSLDTPSAIPLKVYNCVFKPDFIDMELINYKDFADVIHYLSFRSIFPDESDNIEDIKIIWNENAGLEDIFSKMLKEFEEKENGYVQLLRAYVIELLIKMFRSIKQSYIQEGSTKTHHSKLMEQAIQYLKANYAFNPELSVLASQSFLSPAYFCKLFKDYTGITLSEYIQKIRIEEACNLLMKTDDKVIVIAQKVGYKDMKHFNQTFKKTAGVTPSSYRKMHRK